MKNGLTALLLLIPSLAWTFSAGEPDLPLPPDRTVPVSSRVQPISVGGAAAPSGIEWVSLPGGTFLMGNDYEGDARPVHSVKLRPFDITKTPVTFLQYQACINAGKCTVVDEQGCMTEKFRVDGGQPIVCVTWEQARTFAAWAGARLPTEAEWEYAAKDAGRQVDYPWGQEPPNGCGLAVTQGCSIATKPVCSVPRGDTAQGLCDMAGNVWEWTQDVYHSSYNGAPADGSAWEYPADGPRVVRGGSWRESAAYLRSDFRLWAPADTADPALGFRPVRSSHP